MPANKHILFMMLVAPLVVDQILAGPSQWMAPRPEEERLVEPFRRRDDQIWNLIKEGKFSEAVDLLDGQLILLKARQLTTEANIYSPFYLKALRLRAIAIESIKPIIDVSLATLLTASEAFRLGAPWAQDYLDKSQENTLYHMDLFADHTVLQIDYGASVEQIEEAREKLLRQLRPSLISDLTCRMELSKMRQRIEDAYSKMIGKWARRQYPGRPKINPPKKV